MKKIIFIVCLVISGCSPKLYDPQVIGEYNQDKYRKDVEDCRTQARELQGHTSVLYGSFGLAGYAAENVIEDKDSPVFKNGVDMIDECMSAKGYQIVTK